MIKILQGENSFLSKQRLSLLIKESLEKNPKLAYKVIDADSTSISDITNEYETQDMFSKKKLLVLKRLLSNKDHKEFIEKVLSTKDSAKNIDLIVWEEKNIPKNTRYYKLFNEIKAVEEFPKFNKRSFQNWAAEHVVSEKLKINNQLLQTFVEMTNYDPYLFINEIEKFKLAEKESISDKDLDDNINDTYTNNIWEFLDAINQKSNMEKHTKILLNLLKNGLDPHYLMIMIARNIKQLMLIKKMLEEEKDDREMVSILKIPPFTLPRLKGIAKESDYKNLLNIFEKIYNLNYESKIGNIDAELGLILLITRLN
jgi:DNA polymerase III subunit delta